MARMTMIFTLLACAGFVWAEEQEQVDISRYSESPSRSDYFPVPQGNEPTTYEQPPSIYATAYENFRQEQDSGEDIKRSESSEEANYFPLPQEGAPAVYEQPPDVDATIYGYDNLKDTADDAIGSPTYDQGEATSADSTDYFPRALGNGPSVYMLPPPVDAPLYTYYEISPSTETPKKSPKVEVVGKASRFRRTAYSDGGTGSSSSSQAASQASSGSSSFGGSSNLGGGYGDSPLGLSNSGAGSSSSSFASSQAGSSGGGFNFPTPYGFNGGFGGHQLYSGGYPGYGGGFGGFPGNFGGFPSFSGASSGSSSSASSNSAGFPGGLQGFGGPDIGYNAFPQIGGNSVGGYGGDGGLDLLSRSGPGIVVPSVRSGNSGNGKGVFVSSSSNVDKDGKVSYKVASGRF